MAGLPHVFCQRKFVKHMKCLLLTVIGLLAIGCAETNSRYSYIYELFREHRVQPVQVDDKNITNVFPNHATFLGNTGDDGAGMGYGHHYFIKNEHDLFLVDNNRKSLLKYNINTGRLVRENKSLGRGPGEYEHITHFYASDENTFVLDRNQSKLIKLNHNLESIQDYYLNNITAFFSIVAYSHPYLIYTVSNSNKQSEGDYLLYAQNIEDTDDENTFFHKRIIPDDQDPKSYNKLHLGVSPQGEIAVVHQHMPFVFFYDKYFQLTEIIQLKAPSIEAVETGDEQGTLLNPPPIPIGIANRISLRGLSVEDIVFSGKTMYIYYSNRFSETRLLVELAKKNNRWEHTGSYKIFEDEHNLRSVYSIFYSKPWLYLGSPFEEQIMRVHEDTLRNLRER